MSELNVVVFGATGALGSCLARQLVDSGHRVLVSGRDEAKTRELGEELGAEWHVADVRDSGNVKAGVAAAVDTFGQIDGVVNCAGSLLLKSAHTTTDEEWDDVLSTNLTGSFYTVRESARVMQKHGGAIVLVSSAAAQVGLVNHEAIASAKAGVEGLVLSSAATYASRGIRVNAVAPGLVEGTMTERLTANPDSLKVSKAMHPVGRIGRPEDVASAIVWLLGADNDWVTGQIIGVDGGLARLRGRQRVA